MLEDSELQRNNANLVQQVVDGMMQQGMAAKTNTDNNAALLLQASEGNQILTGKIQQMQQSMSVLQAQVANQGSTQPYYDSSHNRGYQGQDQQSGSYQQGRGYQGCSYQCCNYQGRGRGNL
jgi:hypothetical protein